MEQPSVDAARLIFAPLPAPQDIDDHNLPDVHFPLSARGQWSLAANQNMSGTTSPLKALVERFVGQSVVSSSAR